MLLVDILVGMLLVDFFVGMLLVELKKKCHWKVHVCLPFTCRRRALSENCPHMGRLQGFAAKVRPATGSSGATWGPQIIQRSTCRWHASKNHALTGATPHRSTDRFFVCFHRAGVGMALVSLRRLAPHASWLAAAVQGGSALPWSADLHTAGLGRRARASCRIVRACIPAPVDEGICQVVH